MPAGRVLGINDDAGDYEDPARLMTKDDVYDISSVLGLASSALNNYEPLPSPPKYGAGKVNPFSSDKRSKFIEPEESQPDTSSLKAPNRAEHVPTTNRGEKVPRLDLHNVISSLFLSRYKFIPPFLDLYHEVGNQPRDIAGEYMFKFPGTAYGYTLPKEDVRKRAAWAWYRTHLLCQRAAEQLQARGPNQQELGLRALGSKANTELRALIAKHTSKASRAKAQALKLYPKLLEEENVQSPSWKKAWTTEDTRYYKEMADNYDRVQRFELAEEYKTRAMEFICEALSVYLEWKQENPAKAVKYAAAPSGSSLFNSPYFGGAGGLAKVWSEAAQWSFDKDIIPFFSARFRWWWLRAAMARGHAEWLVMELDTRNPSYPARSMNDLKLLPPAPIGCYVNDCVIMSTLGIIHHSNEWPFHQDDKWQTTYTEFQMESREYSWSMYGERNYNFAPGAPDFVYLEQAKKGWAHSLLGMFPSDTSMLAIQTGYFDRYYRQGLAHYMPRSASDYERALAVCVDDIVMEFEQSRYIDILTLPNSLGSNILVDLESEMSSLANARRYLTAAEAERCNFKPRVNGRLEHHLSRIGKLFQTPSVKNLEESAKLIFLMRIQKVVGHMLGPWYKLLVWSSLAEGQAPWHIISRPELPGQIEMSKDMLEKVFSSAITFDMIKYWMLRRIFGSVESCRTSLVAGRSLGDEEWHFITPFRAYLETGSIEKLPLVSSGLDKERECTVSEYRRTKIYRCDGDCGCPFDKAEAQTIKRDKDREAGIGQAMIERNRIKQAFLSRDRESRSTSQRTRPSGPGDHQSQLFLELLSAAANNNRDTRAIENMLTADGRRVLRANERQSVPARGSLVNRPAPNTITQPAPASASRILARKPPPASAPTTLARRSTPAASSRTIPDFVIDHRPATRTSRLTSRRDSFSSSASSLSTLSREPVAPPMKKRGFFSRLFRRRGKKEQR